MFVCSDPQLVMRRVGATFLTRQTARAFTDPASVLGTSLSSSFIEQVKEDLAAEELRKRTGIGGFGDTLRNCISKGELDHMECPEADAAHVAKLDKMVDTLFSRIPLPKDPMKAALAPTKEEVAQLESFEELKEAVRVRYQSSQRHKAAENRRISIAMQKVEDGTHPAFSKVSKYLGDEAVCSEAAEVESMQRELEAMKKKVAALEAQMRLKQQT